MSKLTKTQSSKLDSFKYTSTKIRYLHSLGWSTSDIKNKLNIIYQFARNIINSNVKDPKESF